MGHGMDCLGRELSCDGGDGGVEKRMALRYLRRNDDNVVFVAVDADGLLL